MGRPISQNEEYRERVKQLTTLKLQLPITDDLQALVQGFVDNNPWAMRRPFVTLLRAGQVERGMKYLDADIENFDPKNQPKSMKEALAAFGFTRDDIGDPTDKLRRKEKK